MNAVQKKTHDCFRCEPLDEAERAETEKLDAIKATFSTEGDEVVFVSGYGAIQIARVRAEEISGKIYANNVSPQIRMEDLTVPVAYAVARGSVYTARPADELHERPYRAYWRPL